jgi:hypothetical protein
MTMPREVTESERRARLSGSAVSKVLPEYSESPGSERQWTRNPWNWAISVSSVGEGHKAVAEKDKEDAKSIGAKLTFGEVLDCAVSCILHNLGAATAVSLHDLGMGTAKLLIQAFVQFPNLQRCFGVELAIGRYKLAERNLFKLIETGFNGESFSLISFTESNMRVVQSTVPAQRIPEWKVGDSCLVFSSDLNLECVHGDTSEDAEMGNSFGNADMQEFAVTVLNLSHHHTADVQLKHNGMYLHGVPINRLVPINEVRTLSIQCGSLFDDEEYFKADICILETDFPPAMQPALVKLMAYASHIGSKFLTYHDLKELPFFEWNHLRQLDANVFDNDRYCTSWSQGWRFYLWEHIDPKHSPFSALPVSIFEIPLGSPIVFKLRRESHLQTTGFIASAELCYGELLRISRGDDNNDTIFIHLLVSHERNISDDIIQHDFVEERYTLADVELFKSNHKHRLCQRIATFFPEQAIKESHENRFELARGTVISVNPFSLSYVLRLDDYSEEYRRDVSERHVFNAPKLECAIGENVMACWPRNAQNKNCGERYRRYPARVIGINPDTTYQVQYHVPASMCNPTMPGGPRQGTTVAKYVREMWLSPMIDTPIMFELPRPLCTNFFQQHMSHTASTWSPSVLSAWMRTLCLDRLLPMIEIPAITGKTLLTVYFSAEQKAQKRGELLNDRIFARELMRVAEHLATFGGYDDIDDVSMSSSSSSADHKCPSPVLKDFKLNFLERRNLFSAVQHLFVVATGTNSLNVAAFETKSGNLRSMKRAFSKSRPSIEHAPPQHHYKTRLATAAYRKKAGLTCD